MCQTQWIELPDDDDPAGAAQAAIAQNAAGDAILDHLKKIDTRDLFEWHWADDPARRADRQCRHPLIDPSGHCTRCGAGGPKLEVVEAHFGHTLAENPIELLAAIENDILRPAVGDHPRPRAGRRGLARGLERGEGPAGLADRARDPGRGAGAPPCHEKDREVAVRVVAGWVDGRGSRRPRSSRRSARGRAHHRLREQSAPRREASTGDARVRPRRPCEVALLQLPGDGPVRHGGWRSTA